MERYYLARSTWFINHKYDLLKIHPTIHGAGGKYLNLAKCFGWSNQPKVVTFRANEEILKNIKKSLQSVLKTEWIIIHKKDW